MPAPRPPLHETPLTALKGVGPKMLEKLAKIGLRNVQDVLFHLPLRYQDRTRVARIGSLRPGEEVSVDCFVEQSSEIMRRRRMLVVRVSDGSGWLTLRLFHFSRAQAANYHKGARLRCFGEVRPGPNGLEMVHPETRRIDDATPPPDDDALTPIYPTTEGVHQLTLRSLTDQALEMLRTGGRVDELLPASLRARYHLDDLSDALHYVHRPPKEAELHLLGEGTHPAQRRLAFEELLAHALSLRLLRQQTQRNPAPEIRGTGALSARLLAGLPFKPTGAQDRVIAETVADMARAWPMQRLVQGDVGSGKTLVAVVVALHAVEAGFQAVVMAPTELLAEQHYQNFRTWLDPLGIPVAWLSGKQKGTARRAALEGIREGHARVIVGTHALFQNDVEFDDLGLVIIDEQHRFGVHQRLALREKGARDGRYPHQLIMTATPIPRTLAMTAYADLDVSVIDELPPGRSPVTTVVIPDARREEVMTRIRAACDQGRQAYWVCTLIEESEALQAQAAEDTARILAETLPDIRVALVHGRMKPAEKEAEMAAFKAGTTGLLVATTVIEVGVDVPNASLMVIENAERLGLAQLHQLRGRVGRGTAASACVLMYHPPLSDGAKERLGVMRESSDGFVIAQKDLEIRGPGEVLGTRQTGMIQFRIADLSRDAHLLDAARDAADAFLDLPSADPAPLLARWLGDGVRYGDV
ncbi:MAG: ATP-dependent DNA helicase RecG [Zoogloeaceae bacterium]|nr:ATP-dependent DNA helicase RecG [Zoogloeaceae bacterium]